MRLFQLTSRLDRIYDSSSKVDDDEIKSHLARYLCVLTSGYIEESLRIITQEYVATRTTPNIANYVNSSVSSKTNLQYAKILEFLSSFDSDWGEDFKNQVSEEEKDAINSIVANRHQIAHGRNVGVSYVQISTWYLNTKSVIVKIRNIVNS